MSRTPLRPVHIALLLAVAAMLLIAVRITTPGAARPAGADPALFSAGRAMRDIAAIARAPHPTGTAEHARVRAYLVDRLRGLGLDVSTRAWPLEGKPAERLAAWSGRDVSRVALTDIVGVLPGRDRAQPALLLMAHYDTVWGSPGAADDSAGVTTILEDVRALKAAGIQPVRDIIVLFTDGEELGLDGAAHFFARHELAAHVGVIVNHETRGSGGRTAMFETGANNSGLMRLFARAVPHPSTNSISILIYRSMPNSTDYTVAKQRGIAGFNLAFTGRAALYHSPLATPASTQPAAVQDMGDQSLALTRALATVPALPTAGDDASFSDLLGMTTIAYPPALGWAILAVAAGLLGLAAWRAAVGAAEIGGGAIVAAWGMMLAAALLTAVNALSIGPRHPEYFDRLAALPRLEWQAAAVCLAALAIVAVIRRARRRWWTALAMLGLGLLIAAQAEQPLFGLVALPAALLALVLPAQSIARWPAWLGAQALLLLLAVTVQAIAPTAAPVLAWPALLAAAIAAAVAYTDRARDRWPALLPIGLAVAIGGAQALAFAHFTFSAVGAGLALVMAPFVLILFALGRPLLDLRDTVALRGVVAALLILACGLALWVRFDPVSPTVPVYVRR